MMGNEQELIEEDFPPARVVNIIATRISWCEDVPSIASLCNEYEDTLKVDFTRNMPLPRVMHLLTASGHDFGLAIKGLGSWYP